MLMKCTLIIAAPRGIKRDMELYQVELPCIPPTGTTLVLSTRKRAKNKGVFYVNVTGCDIQVGSETRETDLVRVYTKEDKGRCSATLEDWVAFENTSIDALALDP